MCGQRHKRSIQHLNYIWFAFMKLSHKDASFAIKVHNFFQNMSFTNILIYMY
jgi:hypothetical protein